MTGSKKEEKRRSFEPYLSRKNKDKHTQLMSFLKSCEGPVSADSRCGDFLSLREEILDWAKDDFVFFFVDPMGYTEIEMPNLDSLLRRPNSEFLINFMYEFINRGMGIKDGFDEHKIGLAGKVPDLSGLSSSAREEELLRLYRQEAKRRMPQSSGRGPWSAVVRILNPERNRVKYHLIYLTRSALGVQKFHESMNKSERVQHAIRLDVQQRAVTASGQSSFDFGDLPIGHTQPRNAVDDIKAYWRTKLTKTPQRFTMEDMADLVEETGHTISDIQFTLLQMITNGEVINLDAKGKRTACGVHCDKKERLVLT